MLIWCLTQNVLQAVLSCRIKGHTLYQTSKGMGPALSAHQHPRIESCSKAYTSPLVPLDFSLISTMYLTPCFPTLFSPFSPKARDVAPIFDKARDTTGEPGLATGRQPGANHGGFSHQNSMGNIYGKCIMV